MHRRDLLRETELPCKIGCFSDKKANASRRRA
jgi:hypothetical protein